MKLTKTQFNDLLNQHTGTGYIMLKMSDSTVHIADISVNEKGNWFIGLDSKPLAQKLADIAKEVIYD